MKYAHAFKERFAQSAAFSSRDATLFLTHLGASPQYARLMLHSLVASGRLKRINRGEYTFLDEAATVGLAFAPYYYGLQDALSIHGLWEQETNPVVLTPRRVRPGVRTFAGRNYVVRRINRKMFFGFEPVRYSGLWVNVSDIEKTIIDFAYFRILLQSEVLHEASKRIDKKKLAAYLKRSPQYVQEKVKRWLSKQK